MTDTTDNAGGREATIKAVPGTEGNQPIPANDTPPPTTNIDQYLAAFVV